MVISQKLMTELFNMELQKKVYFCGIFSDLEQYFIFVIVSPTSAAVAWRQKYPLIDLKAHNSTGRGPGMGQGLTSPGNNTEIFFGLQVYFCLSLVITFTK